MPSANRLAIFRAGTHTDMRGRQLTYTPQDLADMAAAYDPATLEAPLVIGHPKVDAPAYGWANRLVAEGDTLFAETHQVDPQFAEAVNAGRYKKMSASFYMPDSAGNPTPGKWYLRHIGFLGAQAPAVQGLPSASFAQGEAATFDFAQGSSAMTLVGRLFRRLRKHLADTQGNDHAMRVLPDDALDELDSTGGPLEPDADADDAGAATADPAFSEDRTMPNDQTAEFAARQQQLDDRDTQLAEREKALKDREAKARRQDVTDFAEGLVQDGKLLPRQKGAVVEVLLALPADTSVSFAAADGETVSKGAGEALRELLAELPKQVDYAEKSRAEGTTEVSADFASAPGTQVDTTRLDLHRKAKEYQRQHQGVDFITAYRAVGGQ